MIEGLRGLLREYRQRPPPPPDGAEPGEHLDFLFRSLLAAMLTWQFALLYAAIIAGALVWEIVG